MPLLKLLHKNYNKKKFFIIFLLPKLSFLGGTSTLKIFKNLNKF